MRVDFLPLGWELYRCYPTGQSSFGEVGVLLSDVQQVKGEGEWGPLEHRPMLTLPWRLREMRVSGHSGQEMCRPVPWCGPQSGRTRSGWLHSELVVLKEVREAAATSETGVWLLSHRAGAERTIFIRQAPESNRDSPALVGTCSGGSGL